MGAVSAWIEKWMRAADGDTGRQQDIGPVVDDGGNGGGWIERRAIRVDRRWQVLARGPDVAVQVSQNHPPMREDDGVVRGMRRFEKPIHDGVVGAGDHVGWFTPGRDLAQQIHAARVRARTTPGRPRRPSIDSRRRSDGGGRRCRNQLETPTGLQDRVWQSRSRSRRRTRHSYGSRY